MLNIENIEYLERKNGKDTKIRERIETCFPNIKMFSSLGICCCFYLIFSFYTAALSKLTKRNYDDLNKIYRDIFILLFNHFKGCEILI